MHPYREDASLLGALEIALEAAWKGAWKPAWKVRRVGMCATGGGFRQLDELLG